MAIQISTACPDCKTQLYMGGDKRNDDEHRQKLF